MTFIYNFLVVGLSFQRETEKETQIFLELRWDTDSEQDGTDCCVTLVFVSAVQCSTVQCSKVQFSAQVIIGLMAISFSIPCHQGCLA